MSLNMSSISGDTISTKSDPIMDTNNILNVINADTEFINKRNEVVIHLMLYDSIHITSKSLKDKDISLKVSLDELNQRDDDISNGEDEENKLSDVEISVMKDDESSFRPQELDGRLYSAKDYLIFRTKVVKVEELVFTIDLYQSGSDGSIDPKRQAFCNIFASHLRDSNGLISMPFSTENGKSVAQLHLEYLIMSPIKGTEDFRAKSYESWLTNRKGYDVGHRGAGIARRTDRIENILENTIASFNFASLHGADLVELDVQLSKDKIPIVYHDFNVNIIMKNKKSKSSTGEPFTEVHTMAIKDLTFQQLQNLQLSPVIKANKTYYDFGGEDQTEEHLPFVSLQKVLECVDPKCGLNVEIKYPQQKICGQWEAEKTLDLNEYVDVIVSTVFQFAGARNIMFSCFHPDICSLLKYKQNRYPVLFLTQGLTKKWQQFRDRRNASIEMAVYWAQCVGLEGINAHAEDIINDRQLISFVKLKNLVLFCWGDDLNHTELIAQLKEDGVDGVVYDRIDILCGKTVSGC